MLLQLGDSCDCVAQSEADEDGVPYYLGRACGGSCADHGRIDQAFVQDEVWVTSETSLVWFLARGNDHGVIMERLALVTESND